MFRFVPGVRPCTCFTYPSPNLACEHIDPVLHSEKRELIMVKRIPGTTQIQDAKARIFGVTSNVGDDLSDEKFNMREAG